MRRGSLTMVSSNLGNRDKGYGDVLNDGPGRVSMLDRALEGATAEAKARVRGVLLRYGIDEDNEFFMIFVAIGHLLVLVEEAPENWQSFFDDIYGELNQWSSQNRKSLESLKLHTQTSAELIQSLRLLIASLTASDEKSNRMLMTLNSFEAKLSSIDKHSVSASENSKQVGSRLDHTNRHLSDLSYLTNQQTWISSVNTVFSILLTLGWLFALWQLTTQIQVIQQLKAQQQDQAEKMEWLLEKANRAECHQGIKPADDPQCQ